MDVDDFLAAVRRDGAAMLDLIGKTPGDTPVPSCPGWTMVDLIVHTGIVHRHKTEVVRGAWTEGPPPQPPGPDGPLGEWFAEGLATMNDVFTAADPTAPTWTWCAHEHATEWWVRRMAHETVVHLADAVLAAGGHPTVPDDLGADGVDEILDEMIVGGPGWGVVTAGARVAALEAGDRRWLLREARFAGTSPHTGNTYEDLPALVIGDGDPDTTIRLEPGDMDLWLWGRGALPNEAVVGDRSLADYLRTVAADATQ